MWTIFRLVRPVDKRQSTKDGVDSNVRAFKKLQVENELVVLLISSLNLSNYVFICDKEFYIIYCLGDIASISLIEFLQALLIDVLFKSYIDS